VAPERTKAGFAGRRLGPEARKDRDRRPLTCGQCQSTSASSASHGDTPALPGAQVEAAAPHAAVDPDLQPPSAPLGAEAADGQPQSVPRADDRPSEGTTGLPFRR
jgi:hypothetical protein